MRRRGRFVDTTLSLAETNDLNYFQRLQRELRIWWGLKHPNVLRLVGTATGFSDHVSFVCPWIEKGSLTQVLKCEGETYSLRRRLYVVSNVNMRRGPYH
jgi:hypothetical protein